jgi:hypothetical protein
MAIGWKLLLPLTFGVFLYAIGAWILTADFIGLAQINPIKQW